MPSPIALSRTQSDSDVSTFLAACVTAGTTLSAGQQSAIYFLVGGLKTLNLWSSMTALYPFIGGSAGAHAINLKSPGTYNITWSVSGVTHNSNGITGNASTGYGDTGLAPSVIGQNSIHLSMYKRTAGGAAEYTMGCSDGATKSCFILSRSSGNNQAQLNDNGGFSTSGLATTGFFLGSRISSTAFSFFNKWVKVKSVSSNTTTPNTVTISILGISTNGSLSGYSSTNLAFASIGSGLTDTQALNLNQLVQAYQTLLGRQV